MSMKSSALLVTVLIGGACSGDSTPTSPSPPPAVYPNVAGRYTGTVTFSAPGTTASVCPAETTVAQTDQSVAIGPIMFSGSCASVDAIRLGNTTISTTGSLPTATASGLMFPVCSGTFTAIADGGFSGNTFQFSLVHTAVSGDCVTQRPTFTIAGTLTR